MASLLRQIVAGPRSRHPEAGLDLCYVTDNIIVTSGPSSTYPQRAYRNPTDALVKFLDFKHGAEWSIWEFRAEGTGYPDSEVYGRIRHYPWPDHHPPPFALVPNIMASMRNWLKDVNAGDKKRVAVVHCKAGKGRSGTVTCSYLISEEGWKPKDALSKFTEKRMRAGFGNGVSIPSQLRWVEYVERWTKNGKAYLERPVEIVELHAWGLRDGVKVTVEGYIDAGSKIKVFHVFQKEERLVVDGTSQNDGIFAELAGVNKTPTILSSTDLGPASFSSPALLDGSHAAPPPKKPERSGTEVGGKAVILRSSSPVIVPTSDVCIGLERRNRATYGWTMVTSVAHVWFNVFFERSSTPSRSDDQSTTDQDSKPSPQPSDSGIFQIGWDAMDGIKGSSRKGTRALDKVAVVWRAISDEKKGDVKVIPEPAPREPVPESKAADWTGGEAKDTETKGVLGMRTASPSSANISKASSIKSGIKEAKESAEDYDESVKGVKTHGLDGNGDQAQ